MKTFYRSTLLALLFATMLTSCGDETSPELIQSAKSLIAKGDFAGASIQLKNALQQQDDGEARYLLAVSLTKVGNLAGAEPHLRRALEQKFSPDQVYPELARVMFGLGKVEKLVAEFDGVKIGDPKAASAVGAVIGEAQIALGRLDKAQLAFAEAISLNPDESRALVGEARLFAANGNLPGAVSRVEAILGKSPENPQALALQAELLVAQQKPDEALEVLGKLIKVAPFNGLARFSMVSLLITHGKFDEAASGIADMKKTMPSDVRGKYLEALLAFRKGQPVQARDAALQVLKAIPEHGPSLVLAGASEFQLGVLPTAEMYLRKAVSGSPDNFFARNLLVATYLRKGQAEKAENTLEYALKKTPNEPTVLRAAGEVAFANNKLTDAARYYEQALSREKDSASLRTRLAQIRFASGDMGRAMDELETASGLSGQEFQADLSLVAAHVSRKEYDKALRAVATLEKKQPNNPLTHTTKGTVYASQNDNKNARDSLERALSIQYNYVPAARILARLDLAEKNLPAAKGRFEAILAKDALNEGALLSLAEVQISGKDPQSDVVATLDRAIKANPGSVSARIALVRFHLGAMNAKDALVVAQAANQSIPNDPAILDALGSSQLAAGESTQAIETFGKLSALDPDSPIPLIKAASAQFAAKQTDASIQTLRKVLSTSPARIDALRQLIVTLVASGRIDEALKEARGVQTAFPKQAIGFALEGDVFANQKRFVEGAAAYAEGIKRQPLPDLAIRQHQLLLAAGKAKEANAVASKWLKDMSGDHVVRLYLAETAMKDRKFPDAVKRYREVLEKRPENLVALNNLAWALHELNDPSALAYAERAYTKAPVAGDVLDTYGWILLNSGQTSRALEILAKAVAASPKSAEVRLHYAKALVKSGDKISAKRELESVVGLVASGPLRIEAEQMLKSI